MGQLHGRGALVNDQPTHLRTMCSFPYSESLRRGRTQMLFYWALHLVHAIYVVVVSVWTRIRKSKWKKPLPLTAHRNKVPAHVCLNLVASDALDSEDVEEALLECLRRAIGWCRATGIETLTVYDRDGVYHLRGLTPSDTFTFTGILVWRQESIREYVSQLGTPSEESGESEPEYPLTPPLSEPSDSRSQSPESPNPPAELSVVTFKVTPDAQLCKRRNVAVRKRQKSKRCHYNDPLIPHHSTQRRKVSVAIQQPYSSCCFA